MGGENDASRIVKNTETHSVILLSLFSGRAWFSCTEQSLVVPVGVGTGPCCCHGPSLASCPGRHLPWAVAWLLGGCGRVLGAAGLALPRAPGPLPRAILAGSRGTCCSLALVLLLPWDGSRDGGGPSGTQVKSSSQAGAGQGAMLLPPLGRNGAADGAGAVLQAPGTTGVPREQEAVGILPAQLRRDLHQSSHKCCCVASEDGLQLLHQGLFMQADKHQGVDDHLFQHDCPRRLFHKDAPQLPLQPAPQQQQQMWLPPEDVHPGTGQKAAHEQRLPVVWLACPGCC